MNYLDDITNVSLLDLPIEKLKNKNILITGSTGLIGSSLIDLLLNNNTVNFKVFAAGRNENKANKLFETYKNRNDFHFLKLDLNESINAEIEFNYVIDCAGVASPQLYTTDPVSVIKSNVFGVENLLSYGIKHNLEKFVYVSSGEIYGEGDGRIFTEDYSGYVNTTNLRSCYPLAKRTAESLCIAYSHQYNIDVSIARPCHIYGPNFSETDKRVYAEFIRNIINNENIIMKSSGEQYRSWCYVVDCVTALLYILLNGKNKEAYNIANENSNITIKELAELIADFRNKKVIIKQPNKIELSGYNPVKKSIFSIDKIKNLGWEPKFDIKTGINHTLNFLIKD